MSNRWQEAQQKQREERGTNVLFVEYIGSDTG